MNIGTQINESGCKMSEASEKLIIKNIGFVLTGRLEEPLIEADTVIAKNGQIAAIGREADLDTADADTEVDANGTSLVIHAHAGRPVPGGLSWRSRCSPIEER